ncbi:hypothetical protein BT67DRAFT_151755 [Trichocladium antarcticum]|uniref:Uncharacterized protein n=1 Tax=Trichocladium antarcticum TaxID=1450529 RepID=A0AAN6ZAW9_9PEZI|nr:hypothetical protein BT67DRAFT_151755 [Trichocladium antarcticum]
MRGGPTGLRLDDCPVVVPWRRAVRVDGIKRPAPRRPQCGAHEPRAPCLASSGQAANGKRPPGGAAENGRKSNTASRLEHRGSNAAAPIGQPSSSVSAAAAGPSLDVDHVSGMTRCVGRCDCMAASLAPALPVSGPLLWDMGQGAWCRGGGQQPNWGLAFFAVSNSGAPSRPAAASQHRIGHASKPGPRWRARCVLRGHGLDTHATRESRQQAVSCCRWRSCLSAQLPQPASLLGP